MYNECGKLATLKLSTYQMTWHCMRQTDRQTDRQLNQVALTSVLDEFSNKNFQVII